MAGGLLLGVRHGSKCYAVCRQECTASATSDGHDTTRQLWEAQRLKETTLYEAVYFCRMCHRAAPFCFYNGNTFAAIIRDVVNQLGLPSRQEAAVRSLAGHIVAGVSSAEEERSLREFSSSLL